MDILGPNKATVDGAIQLASEKVAYKMAKLLYAFQVCPFHACLYSLLIAWTTFFFALPIIKVWNAKWAQLVDAKKKRKDSRD